jgi:hypothetical protein
MAPTIASIVAPIVALQVMALPAVALLVVVLLDTAKMVFPDLALLRESPWHSYCCHHL